MITLVCNGQNDLTDLPKNPKLGHCYVRCHLAEKEMSKWKDVDCALIDFQKLNILSGDSLTIKDKKRLDKIFKKFIKEGYKLQLDSYYTSSNDIGDDVIASRERAIKVANYLVTIGYNPQLIKVSALGPTQNKTGFWYRVINVSAK